MIQNGRQLDILAAWRTNNRVTEFFFEHLPAGLWNEKIPGSPRRTVRMIAGHIHNMAYLVAHEAHHRGQIVLAARALGHRLPAHITSGLWQWKKLSQD